MNNIQKQLYLEKNCKKWKYTPEFENDGDCAAKKDFAFFWKERHKLRRNYSVLTKKCAASSNHKEFEL